jgi:hypothetical protein
MKTFAEIDIENGGSYLKTLSAVSKLSRLFSESSIPYINYRVAENIFCNCFKANNLSRSDTAFDAEYNSMGIGLKTFICKSGSNMEKIAEFNSLSGKLKEYENKDLAVKLAEFRNERIKLAKRIYNIENSLYHIVARKEKELVLFETDYEIIDIEGIQSVKQNSKSLKFDDGKNSYSFNFSKSTLFRNFSVPENIYKLPVEIIDDPYSLLLELFHGKIFEPASNILERGKNFIILPLYSIKNNEKYIHEKSGLNQWNAGGRKRNPGEIYIKIPIRIHDEFPDFFPDRDTPFELKTPTGDNLSAKVCQDNGKALMTNPNNALSNWLLRKVMKVEEGELLTIDKVNELGFDSVIIYKDDEKKYRIDKAKTDSYKKFI